MGEFFILRSRTISTAPGNPGPSFFTSEPSRLQKQRNSSPSLGRTSLTAGKKTEWFPKKKLLWFF